MREKLIYVVHVFLHFQSSNQSDIKKKIKFSPVLGFPDDPVIKNSPGNAGDAGLIPELGRSPGELNGNPLQYSCLGNALERVLQKPVLEKPSTTLEELENSGLLRWRAQRS